jgi:drug/metabolite transporter (DMT)-like permease
VLAAAIAMPVLGERPDGVTVLGILAISTGVAAASGVFEQRRG